MINEHYYLNEIPQEHEKHGFCKVLSVRREVIHIKHIMTEIFVRKTIDIEKELKEIDMNLFDYMEYLTNRIRRIHHLSRQYTYVFDKIVNIDKNRFFETYEILKGFEDVKLVLDFDGVVTSKKFHQLYNLIDERTNSNQIICSANPTINNDSSYFEKNNLPKPMQIFGNKGKKKKIKKLIELQKKHDFVIFVDNESEYLDVAWLFGIYTYKYENGKINYYSRKTK